MTISTKYTIGEELTDVVTGYTGTCMGIAVYANGVRSYGLQRKMRDDDKKCPEPEWLDETRLKSEGKITSLG